MDKDRSGNVSLSEFWKGLEETNCHFNAAEVSRLFESVNTSGSGQLTWNEFSAAVGQVEQSERSASTRARSHSRGRSRARLGVRRYNYDGFGACGSMWGMMRRGV